MPDTRLDSFLDEPRIAAGERRAELGSIRSGRYGNRRVAVDVNCDDKDSGAAVVERECKTALSKSELRGIEYALNPYRGCPHRCAYCYAPAILHYPRGGWGKVVEAKTNLPAVLARELRAKKPGLIAIGSISDPYQPAEERLRITRHCLEQLLAKQWKVLVLTKSDLVLRDIGLLKRFSDCEVEISIGTLDDEIRALLEPGALPMERRLAAVRKLADEGIRTCIFMGPFYPTNKLEELPEIVEALVESGAGHVVMDKLNLREGVADSVRVALAAKPDMLQVWEKALNPGPAREEYYRNAASRLRELCKGRIGFDTAF